MPMCDTFNICICTILYVRYFYIYIYRFILVSVQGECSTHGRRGEAELAGLADSHPLTARRAGSERRAEGLSLSSVYSPSRSHPAVLSFYSLTLSLSTLPAPDAIAPAAEATGGTEREVEHTHILLCAQLRQYVRA